MLTETLAPGGIAGGWLLWLGPCVQVSSIMPALFFAGRNGNRGDAMDFMAERPASAVDEDGRIPVSLLTGFLGSGKTTLLNELMSHPDMAGTVVLINEFGDVSIDHHLVESIDEGAVILPSGCICCSMNGDLIRALRQLHERMARREIPPIRRVVIESTGLANPAPVVNTLMEDRYIAVRYICDGVLTVVDASLFLDQVDRHEEVLRQVALADMLLISKADLVKQSRRQSVVAHLSRLNPSASCVVLRPGHIEPKHLFAAGIYAASRQTANVARWLKAQELQGVQGVQGESNHPDNGVASFVVAFPEAVAWRSFAVAMGRILTKYGDRLLRVKGLMRVMGDQAPVVVQCVQDNAYAPVRLSSWPTEKAFADGRGRLVFIAAGLEEEDRADIRALLANLPGDTAAIQVLASHPNMPTRCWLSARLPILSHGSFETEGWVVMPRRYAVHLRAAGSAQG
jgi:G3E family GTPase